MNRRARKLLKAGVLQRLLDLEFERLLRKFSYETLRKFSESKVEIGHIQLQVSDRERDSKKTNRLVYTVSIFKPKRNSKPPLRKESCDIKAGSASAKPTKETRRKDIGRDKTSNSVTESGKTSSAPVEVRIDKLQHLFEGHRCSGFMLLGEHYDQGTSDTKNLSDELASFAAMDIMDGSSDGDIRFVPNQFAHRMLPDRTKKAFQKNYVDSGIDTVLFSMTVSNHHSLTAIFDLRDAFDSIKDGVTRAPGNAFPFNIVLFDGVVGVGHYNHVVTHIMPWLQKYFKHVFDMSGFKLSRERLPQTLPEIEAQYQSIAGRQVSRMLQACDVFCLREAPAQTDGVSCGWHFLRALWLVADNYINKFSLYGISSKVKRSGIRNRCHPEGVPIPFLSSTKRIASAFGSLSISDTKLRIRNALQAVHPALSPSRSDASLTHRWNKKSRYFSHRARRNRREYDELLPKKHEIMRRRLNASRPANSRLNIQTQVTGRNKARK